MSEIYIPGDVLNTHQLKQVPMFQILIRRARFRLDVYRRDTALARYYEHESKIRIAVGAIGFTTPGGAHYVMAKARNPDWHVPDSPWATAAGYTPGTVIPGGDPANPIREAFLKLTDDGVGIHGTTNLLSLGSKASHGCIRVSPEDAIWLYDTIPAGTPVMIV